MLLYENVCTCSVRSSIEQCYRMLIGQSMAVLRTVSSIFIATFLRFVWKTRCTVRYGPPKPRPELNKANQSFRQGLKRRRKANAGTPCVGTALSLAKSSQRLNVKDFHSQAAIKRLRQFHHIFLVEKSHNISELPPRVFNVRK